MMLRAKKPRVEKFIPDKVKTAQTLTEWFAQDPPIWGVVVYERLFKPRYRLGLLLTEVDRDLSHRFKVGSKLDASAQPDQTWKGAKVVGIALTLEEAMRMIFPQ